MTIVVTGATGHLGQLTVQALLARGVPAQDIVAGGRNTDALQELAGLGVRTAVVDYTDPATLRAAVEKRLYAVSRGGRLAGWSRDG